MEKSPSYRDIREELALAVLRAGRSYQEAADSSGLDVEEVIDLWERMKNDH